MKVLVLGSGPAGLIACHTAALRGAGVLVYSRGQKSPLYGCQYLHRPIPGMTTAEPVQVSYVLHGTTDGYRDRVYGLQTQPIAVSPETLTSEHLAWDIRQTYDALWETYGRFVQTIDFNLRAPQGLIAELDPDVVVSTIPANVLCRNSSHRFATEEIWAIGDAPDLGQSSPIRPDSENTVVCNGEPFGEGASWYRTSCIFGYATTEWPGRIKKPPFPGVARVQKPLSTNCDCEKYSTAPIFKAGRYGLWRKGVLADSAMEATIEAMDSVAIAGGQGVLW